MCRIQIRSPALIAVAVAGEREAGVPGGLRLVPEPQDNSMRCSGTRLSRARLDAAFGQFSSNTVHMAYTRHTVARPHVHTSEFHTSGRQPQAQIRPLLQSWWA